MVVVCIGCVPWSCFILFNTSRDMLDMESALISVPELVLDNPG
jgi:hypothetical protein